MQRQIFQSSFSAPFGQLFIAADDAEIVRISFREMEFPMVKTPVIYEAWRQISEYFAASRQEFSLPLANVGTQFQRKCWNALLEIPYGEVLTYKAMAERVGYPTACRAVAGACARNPFPIIVPCHRVVATNSLGGFAGGLEAKRFLLDLERRNIVKNQN